MASVKKTPPKQSQTNLLMRLLVRFWAWFRPHWVGSLVILGATLIFFSPILTRISSYSEGGDAMFNAWTISRNHHCIMRDGCPSYVDGNIYFPNKDSMLYSETQLSAGFVTLPLYWINDNPLFTYNILTILTFFLAGWFMYLLAKYLSKNHELISILSGLLFAFAPYKVATISHLQNLGIFVLPLIVLLILKYIDTVQRKYLLGLFFAALYIFYASWVQMVFVIIAVGILMAGMFITHLASIKKLLSIALYLLAALVATLPLMSEYMRFSSQTETGFGLSEQVRYSSNLADYFMPQDGTVFGEAFYRLSPDAVKNTFNPDGISYHGLTVYLLAVFVLFAAVYLYARKRRQSEVKNNLKLVSIFVFIALVGFIISLGPFLKIKGNAFYGLSEGINLVLPMPWLIVNEILPQIGFIRAIGRATVIFLFALCCLLALLPYYFDKFSGLQKVKVPIAVVIALLCVIELMPLYRFKMAQHPYAYNLSIPRVYEFIKESDVNNIVILNADYDYPGVPIPFARAEQVLWAGYHNKNIFNGYSGYTPPNYVRDFEDYVDFDAEDVVDLKSKDMRYVLVDKQLMTGKPWVRDRVGSYLSEITYEDDRYTLFKL